MNDDEPLFEIRLFGKHNFLLINHLSLIYLDLEEPKADTFPLFLRRRGPNFQPLEIDLIRRIKIDIIQLYQIIIAFKN